MSNLARLDDDSWVSTAPRRMRAQFDPLLIEAPDGETFAAVACAFTATADDDPLTVVLICDERTLHETAAELRKATERAVGMKRDKARRERAARGGRP